MYTNSVDNPNTTLALGPSSTTITTGATSGTFTHTINIATAPTAATYTKTVNIGTALSGGTGTINIGTGVTSGTATLNIGSTSTTTTMNGAVTITSLTATNSIVGSITGNAATATKLGTARAINGVNFDGSAAITIKAATPNYLTFGTGLIGTTAEYDGSTAVTVNIDQTVALKADTHYIGTTSIALNRSSASQTLTGVSIDGNAATVTDGVYTSGTYSNPAWITSLAYSKLTGAPTIFSGSYNDLTNKPTIPTNTSELANDSGYITAAAIPAQFTFNVAADDSTLRAISTEETIKFIGAGGITTASDAEGAITITQGAAAAGTLTGSTLASGVTASSLTSVGTLNGLSINGSAGGNVLTISGTGRPANGNIQTWNFYTNTNVGGPGSYIEFPDGTYQATAYTGNASTVTNGVYTTDTGTVTNTMLAGSIANSKLANSSVTIGTTAISLGSSSTTLAGLTSVTSTSFVGSLTGNASTVTNGVYTTSTGVVTNAMLAGSIANSKLANSSVTVNGTSITLGGSGTITVNSIAASGFSTVLGFDGAGNLILSNGTMFRAPSGLTIETGSPTFKDWTFSTTGTLTFPDSTVQTTAWTGVADYNNLTNKPTIPQAFTFNVAADDSTLRTIDREETIKFIGAGGIVTSSDAEGAITITAGGTTVLGSTTLTIGGTTSGLNGLTSINATLSASSFFATPNETVNLFAGAATVNIGKTTGTIAAQNILTIPDSATSSSNSATNRYLGIGSHGQLFDDGNLHIHTDSNTLWINSLDSGDIRIGTQYNSGSGSDVYIGKDLYVNSGSVTANATTAFIAGSNAISGVALQMPSEAALRNLTNGSTNMYFDVSIGGTTQGQFQFRSSSSYTNVLTMSPTAVSFNTDATVTSRTPSLARTAFNAAIDTEITVDNMRFRISNQGGIFPQVIGNGSSRNLAWTGVGAISGAAVAQVGSTGTIVSTSAWVTLFNAHGMDSAGDTVTVTLQDKAEGRIYRITFMRSDNGSITGYNIIGERIL